MSRSVPHSIGELVFRIEELERRLANILRPARVTDVNAADGTVRVDAGGLASPWLPWMEQAGSIRTWTPPSPGQQVFLMSPSGDPAQGWVMRAGFSNQNRQPHDQENETMLRIGGTTIMATADGITITAASIELRGASLTHNGRNIGSTHVHGGVMRGGARTDHPE